MTPINTDFSFLDLSEFIGVHLWFNHFDPVLRTHTAKLSGLCWSSNRNIRATNDEFGVHQALFPVVLPVGDVLSPLHGPFHGGTGIPAEVGDARLPPRKARVVVRGNAGHLAQV
jgi:hypothetical protein